MLNNYWSNPDAIISNDNCLTNGGEICGDKIIHFQFPQGVLQLCSHINQLEFVVLVITFSIWALNSGHQKVLFKFDNEYSDSSEHIVMQSCFLHLHKILGYCSCDAKTTHICSQNNCIFNSFSRGHLMLGTETILSPRWWVKGYIIFRSMTVILIYLFRNS